MVHDTVENSEGGTGSACPECGVRAPIDGVCRDRFHVLLAKEWNVPGGVGEDAHFQAVAAYVLQHPDSMGYSNDGLATLRRALIDHLHETRPVDDVRSRMQGAFEGSTRVRADPDESVDAWRRSGWPVTVADVLEVGPETEAYRDVVREWAESVVEHLDD